VSVYYKSQVIGYASEDRGKVQDFIAGMVLSDRHKKCEIIQPDSFSSTELRNFIYNKEKEKDGRLTLDIKNGSWRIMTDTHVIDHTKKLCSYQLQGKCYDLKVFDGAYDMSDEYYKASILWCRRDVLIWDYMKNPDLTDIKPQAVLTMDIKKLKSSDWVYKYFEPWLLGKVTYGEIVPIIEKDDGSFVITDNDRDEPFIYRHGEKIYDFDWEEVNPLEIVRPQTRTLILE